MHPPVPAIADKQITAGINRQTYRLVELTNTCARRAKLPQKVASSIGDDDSFVASVGDIHVTRIIHRHVAWAEKAQRFGGVAFGSAVGAR